jgi:RecG-like helicase
MGINRTEDEMSIMDLDVTMSITGTMVMGGVGRGKTLCIVGAVVDHADAALVPTEIEVKAM